MDQDQNSQSQHFDWNHALVTSDNAYFVFIDYAGSGIPPNQSVGPDKRIITVIDLKKDTVTPIADYTGEDYPRLLGE